METTHSFGYWVTRRRKAMDLTRAELAGRVGCAIETIKKIERDERRPSQQVAEFLAHALDVPAEEMSLFLQVARKERSVDALPLALAPLLRAPRLRQDLRRSMPSLSVREVEAAHGFVDAYPAGIWLIELTKPVSSAVAREIGATFLTRMAEQEAETRR